MKNKSKSAFISVLSNLFLIVFKLIIGIFSGSISVISDAAHSGADLFSAFITFLSVQISSRKPDKQHNYGHEKMDDISGLISAICIVITGIAIIIVAINKIMCPTPINHIDIAFITMIVSAIINLVVSLYLKDRAKQYNSIALQSESLHRFTDVASSSGIALSLFLVWLTHFVLLDSIISIIIGIYICYESIDIFKKSINDLLDSSISDDEINQITNILNKYKNSYNNYYDLKTRKNGNKRYIEMKLNVNGSFTMDKVSTLCHSIEKSINNVLNNSDVMIQVESNYNDDDNKLTCKFGNRYKNKLTIKFLYKNK